jgi:hypothetical protein
VAEADLHDYTLLGSGSGQFPGMAIFMAFRHCPGFYERVVAYRLVHDRGAEVLEGAVGEPFGSIEFYEARASSASDPTDASPELR